MIQQLHMHEEGSSNGEYAGYALIHSSWGAPGLDYDNNGGTWSHMRRWVIGGCLH